MALNNIALVSLTQAKNFLRISPNFLLHVDAEYVGTGNGETKVFTLDNTPVEGSLRLYVNNVLQTNYTISGSTVTFASPPADESIITASYDKPTTGTLADDDELIEKLIETATRIAEEYTGRAFVQRDITETHLGDGTQILKLYKLPIISIDTITIDDEELTTYSQRLAIGRIYHPYAWPVNSEIVVTYKAGYGDLETTQASVPNAVTAVLLIVSDLYENRGDKVDSINIGGLGSVSYKAPSRALELLDTLRVGAKGLG